MEDARPSAEQTEQAYRLLCEHAIDRKDDGVLSVPCPLRTLALRMEIDEADAAGLLKEMLEQGWIDQRDGHDEVIVKRRDGVKRLAGESTEYVPPHQKRSSKWSLNDYIPVRGAYRPPDQTMIRRTVDAPKIERKTVPPVEPVTDLEVVRILRRQPTRPVSNRPEPRLPLSQYEIVIDGVLWVNQITMYERLAKEVPRTFKQLEFARWLGTFARTYRREVFDVLGKKHTLYDQERIRQILRHHVENQLL